MYKSKKSILSAVLAMAVTISTPAFAQLYVSADLAGLDMATTGISNPMGVDVAFGSRGEKSGNWRFSSETGVLVASDASISDATGTINLGIFQVHTGMIAEWRIPDSTVSLNAGLGASGNYMSGTGTGAYSTLDKSAMTFDLNYSVGVGLDVAPNMTVRVKYQSLGKFKADTAATGKTITSMSAGLVYAF